MEARLWDDEFDGGGLEDPPPEETFDDEPEVEVQDEKDADQGTKRDEDLPLEEVPEHLRDAVEGSLKLKKILENSGQDDDRPAKRRKLGDDPEAGRESDPDKEHLLRKLRLEDDLVCRYVVEAA